MALTSIRHLWSKCLNGNPEKTKFRIRGYGDGTFRQVHQKDKDLFTVIKKKQRISPISVVDDVAPEWYKLTPEGEDVDSFTAIRSNADQYGELRPVIRVKYKRYRYRAYDYRMTLDTNVEVSGFANSIVQRETYGVLPDHVRNQNG